MGFDLSVVLSVLGGGMYWDGVGGTPWEKKHGNENSLIPS